MIRGLLPCSFEDSAMHLKYLLSVVLDLKVVIGAKHLALSELFGLTSFVCLVFHSIKHSTTLAWPFPPLLQDRRPNCFKVDEI